MRDRLMVGRLILDQVILVRAQVPQPAKLAVFISKNYYRVTRTRTLDVSDYLEVLKINFLEPLIHLMSLFEFYFLIYVIWVEDLEVKPL